MPARAEIEVALFAGAPQTEAALRASLSRLGASLHCFRTPQRCLESLSKKPLELLILDFDGQAKTALQVLVSAREISPLTRPVVLVHHGDVSAAVQAMKAGAANCLEKPVEMPRLLETLESELSRRLETLPMVGQELTKTETAVLNLVLAGMTTCEVAATMCRSKRTIEVHRRNIMRKLQADGLVDLMKKALKLGMIDLEQLDGNGLAADTDSDLGPEFLPKWQDGAMAPASEPTSEIQ